MVAQVMSTTMFDQMVKIYMSTGNAYEQAEAALTTAAQDRANFDGQGRLTQQGERILRRLLTLTTTNGGTKKLSDQEIAEIMDMDTSTVFRRRKQWGL